MLTGNLALSKLVEPLIIFLAVIAVAVADVMLKKAAAQGDLGQVLRSPWLLCAIGLYLLQIGLFILIFLAGWKLSIIGALQTALYALIVMLAGVLIYHENLTRLQIIGVILALSGVVLINWN